MSRLGKHQGKPKRNQATQVCRLQWNTGSLVPPQSPEAHWGHHSAPKWWRHGLGEKLWEVGMVGQAPDGPAA